MDVLCPTISPELEAVAADEVMNIITISFVFGSLPARFPTPAKT